jgi:hypothetical protein
VWTSKGEKVVGRKHTAQVAAVELIPEKPAKVEAPKPEEAPKEEPKARPRGRRQKEAATV